MTEHDPAVDTQQHERVPTYTVTIDMNKPSHRTSRTVLSEMMFRYSSTAGRER